MARRKKHARGSNVLVGAILVAMVAFGGYRLGPAPQLAPQEHEEKQQRQESQQNQGDQQKEEEQGAKSAQKSSEQGESQGAYVTADQIPAYEGAAYTPIHQNRPYFTVEEIADFKGESFSPLDRLGRCKAATALVTREGMPTAPRGEIGSVKPTGWQTIKYPEIIKDRYLYNRCHLIGYQLTGQNANPRNLITGTRYLNIVGMEPFESLIAAYVKAGRGPVLYRVTPIFQGEEPLARGVLMEAYSTADQGRGISFCIFCYNVQPGIDLDYSTGNSQENGDYRLSMGDYFSQGFVTPKIMTGDFKNGISVLK